MTNTTNDRKGLYVSTIAEAVLLDDLGFAREPGCMGWFVSRDGLVRFAWDDAEAMAFTLYRFQGVDRSCLDGKLEMSGRFTYAQFRAVVAGFGS